MKQPTPSRRSKALALAGAVCAAALFAAVAPPAFALKFAAVEHHLKVDPATPVWKPAAVQTEPEDGLGLVGADVRDESCLGWAKTFREAYPHLSRTLDLRAS
ncbi:MAG: phosphate ABC transporter substrate-binding protein, PhoT family, partial [Rudaea sp.]|nr:phosphate ABC transporter substrate-binding protein, PhoT family [Rudaea sp.]